MARSSKPLILIAEDNPDDVAMLRRAFEQTGIDVTLQFAADGDAAIALLLELGESAGDETWQLPDFVLVDLKMPGKDGFEVIRWIRGQERFRNLPIIVLTCSDEIRDVNMAYALGANSFLTKPVEFTEFKNTLYAAYTFWVKDRPVPPSVAGASEEVRPES